jgi:hypothetical protein
MKRKSMKRKTMKRKSMKRRNNKRNTMRRKNSRRNFRRMRGGVTPGPCGEYDRTNKKTCEKAKGCGWYPTDKICRQTGSIARIPELMRKIAKEIEGIGGKLVSAGIPTEDVQSLLNSIFWPELLRLKYNLTKDSNTFTIDYKGGRYGPDSADPMAHTWSWGDASEPLKIQVSYPTNGKFLEDNVHLREERLNEAINCYNMIKKIETLIQDNKLITKVGDTGTDHSFNAVRLETQLKMIVERLTTKQVVSTLDKSRENAIVIHDLNKNDIDDIWAILQCIISYNVVYLQETTDDPRLFVDGSEHSVINVSNAANLKRTLLEFAGLYNCDIVFVSKKEKIGEKLKSEGITSIDCYYIAGLPDPGKHFGFKKLHDTLVTKMGKGEINYIIQGKPPSLEKFDYLDSELGIIELLHDSQKQTLGLSSNVRSGGKFSEINFPFGLIEAKIDGMDVMELEAECRQVYIHDERNAGDSGVDAMKLALKTFYNPERWKREQLNWGATSGSEPGVEFGRVAPSIEAWFASENYAKARDGTSTVNYAIEVTDKVDKGFITRGEVGGYLEKSGGQMYKTSLGLKGLYDSLTSITNGDNPVNVYFYAKPKTSTPGYTNRLEISNEILMGLATTPLGVALNYRYIGGVDRQTPFLKDARIPDDGSGTNTLADLEAVLWFTSF